MKKLGSTNFMVKFGDTYIAGIFSLFVLLEVAL